MIERDEELHGKSSNAKIFVLLTDGQAWSGEIARSLRLAAARQIPMFAVGVGTLSGGRLPEAQRHGDQFLMISSGPLGKWARFLNILRACGAPTARPMFILRGERSS